MQKTKIITLRQPIINKVVTIAHHQHTMVRLLEQILSLLNWRIQLKLPAQSVTFCQQ